MSDRALRPPLDPAEWGAVSVGWSCPSVSICGGSAMRSPMSSRPMRGELALASRHPVIEAEVALYADWAGQQMLGQSALYLRRGDDRLGWEGLLMRARKAMADDPPADTRETHGAALPVSPGGVWKVATRACTSGTAPLETAERHRWQAGPGAARQYLQGDEHDGRQDG
ncbi:hypothetical protein ABZ801_35870 [Actinomadura sp. NPDC047616]|uniref:hypothetical protein n=1 Tax=Actinomadura sp. NPDC047616 TaxID=3155914 RepID=UPI0033F93E8E